MKTKLTKYRESIAKMRYYLAQLSGGGASNDLWVYEAVTRIAQHLDGKCSQADIAKIIAETPCKNADVLKYAALLTYELNRLPYQPPRPKRGLIARCFRLLKP